MKIVLAPVGTRGDVQPMLGLAVALLRRGHDVTVCAADNFRALVEKAGARFAAGGRDTQQVLRETGEGIKNPLTFLRVGRQLAREQFALLEDAARGADVVVGSTGLAAGPTIAAAVGARFFWAAYQPQALPTKEHPPMVFATPSTPRFLWPAAWALYQGALGFAVGGLVDDERKRRGQAPAGSVARYQALAPWLCAFDEALSPAPRDWDVEHHVTGFWFFDGEGPFPPELERFLDDGEAPVFVGFGSMPADDPARTTTAVKAALDALGCRAVVSAGWGGVGRGIASERVFVVDGGLDHRRLFPRCSAVVHHGGAGTTAQAARAGVPQVVVPHMMDQHHWADRVHRLGVGPRPLPRRFSSTMLAEALDRARAAEARRAAHRLAAAMTSARGVEHAADLIEASH